MLILSYDCEERRDDLSLRAHEVGVAIPLGGSMGVLRYAQDDACFASLAMTRSQ